MAQAPNTIPGTTYPLRTENCENHETRMDKIDADINKGKGWFQAVCGICSLVVLLVGFVGSNIINKLNNIESMLGTDKSDIRMLNERVQNLTDDVKEIKLRHSDQDRALRNGASPK